VTDQDGIPPAAEAPLEPSQPGGRPRVPANRKVGTAEDWATLKNEGLTSVIDPAVVRIADLFLRGNQAASTANWAVIKTNLASLVAFVDSLVLEPGIPVFDYWYTFWEDREFPASDAYPDPNRIFDTCGPAIVPVSVASDVWSPLRTDVFVSMRNAAAISSDISGTIENNLRSMRWGFDPNLDGEDLTTRPSFRGPSGSPLVNSYLYVALLFSGYAAQLGGAQVLSPDQSGALLLASSGDLAEGLLTRLSGAPTLSARQPDQGGLFAELNEVIGDGIIPVTLHRPCFLPYLLDQGARTPAELFAKAIAMRDWSEVRDYRAWMQETEPGLIRGHVADSRKKEINTIAAALRHRTEPTTPKVTVDLIHLSATVTLNLTRARDWLCSSWPGKRYRRLIHRLAISKKERFDLTQGSYSA
jgi:hypothetical protein